MGCGEYLKELLRPLRIYSDRDGASAWELECYGAALDGVQQALEEAEREAIVETAKERGLSRYEEILPFIPLYFTEHDRRRAIEALLRIGRQSFTLQAMRDTIAGCGIRATVEEASTPLTVEIAFPYNRGVPENFDRLQGRIEQILPCHLAVEYTFIFLLWQELEEWLDTWETLESECQCWRELEAYSA
jgi:hypothetical protein